VIEKIRHALIYFKENGKNTITLNELLTFLGILENHMTDDITQRLHAALNDLQNEMLITDLSQGEHSWGISKTVRGGYSVNMESEIKIS